MNILAIELEITNEELLERLVRSNVVVVVVISSGALSALGLAIACPWQLVFAKHSVGCSSCRA